MQENQCFLGGGADYQRDRRRDLAGALSRALDSRDAAIQAAVAQPPGFTLRAVPAGNLASFSAGRTGRRTSSPPQLGQRPCSTVSAQCRQNVHSKEQII